MWLKMTAAGRRQLLSFLNTQEWYNHLSCTHLFKKTGPGYYMEASGSNVITFPQLDSYDVRYLEGTYSTAAAWTQAAMDYFDARWGSGQAGATDILYGSKVPQRGEWGPFISNENGAAGNTWRGLFVNAAGAFF